MRGFSQGYKVDCDETFSPRSSNLRRSEGVLAIAAPLKLKQFDVKADFLYTVISVKIISDALYFLGIEIGRKLDGLIHMGPSSYAEKVFQRFHMFDANPDSMPV